MSASLRKILIIGPSWIGDMVMAQSLFKTLKEDNPTVIIDVLALAWTAALLDRMPEVNKSIPMPVGHGSFGWNMRKKIGHKLRKEQYDQAIVLPNTWKSALIPWFANIPIRTGWRGEMRYGLLNDLRVLDKEAVPMMVQRYVSLAHPASQSQQAPSYPTPLMIAEDLTTEFQFDHSYSRLIFCPGAEFGSAKQWPARHFADLAEYYFKQDWQLFILGSQADEKIANEIIQQINPSYHSSIINLCGKTQLSEAIDLLGTADLVVSNDSGLMHITAALQEDLIVIYGATSPSFTPPLAKNAQIVQLDVDCGPCFQKECPEQHHKCMVELTSDVVLSRTQQPH